jgi:uncharacterized repeat protein (TIGR03803 family)
MSRKISDRKSGCLLLLFGCFALATNTLLQAQTYTDLFDFDGTNHGCCSIYPGVLAQGRDGSLYGTTTQGGANSRGAIFKSTLNGTVTLLHSFNLTDGASPQGGLTLAADGNFYGATPSGGTDSAGVIFKITSSGTFTVIYNFTRGTDGGFPKISPVPGNDGALYGTTGVGGSIFYKVTTAGVLTPLGSLSAETYGPLTLSTDGKFYGVTNVGGTNNVGTAFSVTTTGVVKTIFNFAASTGSLPYGPLMLSADGNFYGTAYTGGSLGGGVVYKLTPTGVYTVLHSFNNTDRSQGLNPTTGLIQGSDGFLYGVTSGGGAHLFGTMFKIKTDSTGYADILDFDGSHGAVPYSQPLLHTNGTIYGQTNAGGAHNDGVIYSLAAGLKAFIQPVPLKQAKVGASVGILGQNLSTATQVLFGTGAGTFTVTGNTFMNAKPATGATTGVITVKEPGGNLVSPLIFKIVPALISFAPPSGAVGTQVILTGTSFTGATSVKFASKAATFTVNSDTKITTTVPTGAVTGKISVTTPGGVATSATNFTVE